MPSLFFDLLFIGFPVGALIGATFFSINIKSFIKTLWILQGALVISIIASLFTHNFDYLRIHLFDVEVSQLLINIAIFAVLFIPFFIAYGLSEYIGYQIGRQRFSAKMRGVYAIYLFGAAASYLIAYWAVPFLGITKSLLVVLLIMGISGLLITQGKKRLMAILQIVIIIACFFTPNLEKSFLKLYKGVAPLSTQQFEQRGFDMAFQEWGRYSLTEIMASPDGTSYFGFYNDFFQWEFHPRYGFYGPSMGAVPIKLAEKESSIAIIGSGGGRQVRYASVIGHTDITAVEIEPAVVNAVRNKDHLRDEFQNVYDVEGVNLIRSEGRQFLNSVDKEFDLIFLPSVGGYPQMMLEPGNLIRTIEAYKTIKSKLSKDGYFAIWYPLGLDEKGLLTDQYVRTLRSLEMNVRAYKNQGEFLILARKDLNLPLPTVKKVTELLTQLLPSEDRATVSPNNISQNIKPVAYNVNEDKLFRPVTDDRPFLGGNLRHIFSTTQVIQLYGFGAIILFLVGILTWLGLRKRGNPKIPNKTYNSVALLSFFLGANFLVVEHHLVLMLFQTTFVYSDALMIGAVSFLILSGIGSMISTHKIQKPLIVLSIITFIISIVFSQWLPQLFQLILIIPTAIVSGMFFPTLFERASKNPLGVFAFDAIGAGVGSLLAASIPLLLGFKVFGYVSIIIFVLTVFIDKKFHNKTP